MFSAEGLLCYQCIPDAASSCDEVGREEELRRCPSPDDKYCGYYKLSGSAIGKYFTSNTSSRIVANLNAYF